MPSVLHGLLALVGGAGRVVEDEVLIMTANDLRTAGYSVLEAGNAAEALTLLKSNMPVDLVSTDIRMPGSLDRVKLASIIRELWPTMKIIVLSAYHPSRLHELLHLF
jgi:YesN/AraC family two-component response regulator